ncbi:hypothetical protein GCM10027447_27800 [Glycomyces halotolerans]
MTVLTPQKLAEMKQALGSQLAHFRRAKGPHYTQEKFADDVIGYTRSSIANTERGKQVPPRSFWETVDQLLEAGGELLDTYDELQAQHRAYQRQQAVNRRKTPADLAAWDPNYERKAESTPTTGIVQPSAAQTIKLNLPMGARDHAAALAMRDIPPVLVEQLEAEAQRHAYNYATTAPLVLLRSLENSRQLACRALENSSRPATTSRLLRVAAQSCGLAATTAFDLGLTEAAVEYSQAAYVYADFSGQPEHREWVRSVQATLSFWDNDPQSGLEYALDGLRTATGHTAARLHAIAARARSLMGEKDNAIRSLDRAHETIEEDGTSLPGELDFSRSRLALCSAAVYVAIGDGRSAAEHATFALRFYEETPRSERRFAVAYGARMELAAAHIIDGDAEAVPDVLAPALSVPPELRTSRLTRRLSTIRCRLDTPELQNAREVREVRAQIEDFRLRSLPARVGDLNTSP